MFSLHRASLGDSISDRLPNNQLHSGLCDLWYLWTYTLIKQPLVLVS